MKKKLPITEETRNRIIELHLQGKQNIDIAKEMELSTSAVQRHISDYKKALDFNSLEHFDVDALDCWVIPTSSKNN
jgi:DNA-binding NarL/FixJ family response regulator